MPVSFSRFKLLALSAGIRTKHFIAHLFNIHCRWVSLERTWTLLFELADNPVFRVAAYFKNTSGIQIVAFREFCHESRHLGVRRKMLGATEP
jgi:hypothetical protein